MALVLIPALAYGLSDPPSCVSGPVDNGSLRVGETAACLDCHDDHAAQLVGGPHQVTAVDGTATEAHLACTDCHAGEAGHWQDDPEATPMVVPAELSAAEVVTLCTQCHASPHQDNALTVSPHTAAGVGCLDCHQVHAAPAEHQLKSAEPSLCYSCHGDQRADFAKPYHHAVGQGIVNCSDCHLASDDNLAPLASQGDNAACFRCHAEMQGPFPYEHQATLDWSTEGGGCAVCHDPHGSYLPRMLNQPYESPTFQLCTQCHVVPKHNFSTEHGTEWAGVSCSECHTEIHGSYTSYLFLSPALEARGCFVCHTQ